MRVLVDEELGDVDELLLMMDLIMRGYEKRVIGDVTIFFRYSFGVLSVFVFDGSVKWREYAVRINPMKIDRTWDYVEAEYLNSDLDIVKAIEKKFREMERLVYRSNVYRGMRRKIYRWLDGKGEYKVAAK